MNRIISMILKTNAVIAIFFHVFCIILLCLITEATFPKLRVISFYSPEYLLGYCFIFQGQYHFAPFNFEHLVQNRVGCTGLESKSTAFLDNVLF